MKRLFNLRVATKIYMLIVLFVMSVIGASWAEIKVFEKNLYEARELHLHDVVTVVVSRLEILEMMVKSGEMSLEDAQATSAKLLASVRYGDGNDGYIFAIDYTGTIVAHARADLLGTNHWDVADSNGVEYFQEMISDAKSDGGGTTYYMWDRGTDAATEDFAQKMSVSVAFEPWGWIVGTGVFTDELDAKVDSFVLNIVEALAIGSLIALIVGGLVARSVARPINRLKDRMMTMSEGNFDDEVPYADGRNEVAQMAQSILVFRDELKAKADMEAAEESQRLAREEDLRMQHDIVDDLGQGLNKLASGDLQANISREYTGVYARLREDFNRTASTLRDVIGNIIEVSREIEARSRGINASAQQVAVSSERSASTLEQTAAALEELTNTVTQAAQSAVDVDGIVTAASDRAAESGSVVDHAVGAMNEIEISSKEISKITNVIDDIAFQTNLLALNAGVEAARAGESGQGFAVVASEVRALAGRASEAASEIKTLINASGDEVARGSELVDGAGKALAEISQSVSQISGHVADITSGTKEQSIGLAEINNAMTEIDRSTQQNTAMFQETLSESEILTRHAVELGRRMGQFKLSKQPGNPQAQVA